MKGENESLEHFLLKKAALVWLHEQGARTIAFEVPVRTPEWDRVRVDVAAHEDRAIYEVTRGPRGGRTRRVGGRVDELIAVECKAHRSDFLKDSRKKHRLLHELHRLEQERLALEETIRREEPHLHVCESLFPEETHWCYERTGNPEYLKTVRKSLRLAKNLHRGTKFESLVASGMFHRHYLCAPKELADASELPAGWGLIEVDLDTLTAEKVVESRPGAVEDPNRDAMIRSLGRAGTKALVRAVGLTYGEAGLEEPEEVDEEPVESSTDSR